MDTSKQLDLVRRYHDVWGELDESSRLAELEAIWAEDGVYVGSDTPRGLTGHQPLSDEIAASHQELPGLRITAGSAVSVLGDRAWYRWIANTDDGEEFGGTDFIEFTPDGCRIKRVTNFFDETDAGD